MVLSVLRRHGGGDGVPMAEGDLMGGLGKHRIDRAGHDAGTGLHRRR
ncbi:hypothetical protein ABZZ74_37830 [Streptomyces sp. NPDC006476]